MLKDKVRIKIQSGDGGKGSMHTRVNRPAGGNGGNGGDVYLKGSNNIYDLGRYDYNKTYKAEKGQMGQQHSRMGSDGKDLILLVPIVTEVRINGELMHKVIKDQEVIKIAEGGDGGYGNTHLRKNPSVTVAKNRARTPGETLELDLLLKLQSDVIFIGYPNAGKSSLLNLLAKANVKTAAYAFTTLDPQLGLMDGLRLMDLPGLIEGSFEGKGVGTKFLKHTENSTLVAHFVSLEEENPMSAYKIMREELGNIDSKLAEKEEIIILTKTDLLEEDEVKVIEQEFRDAGHNVLSCTIIDDEAIELIQNEFMSLIRNSK